MDELKQFKSNPILFQKHCHRSWSSLVPPLLVQPPPLSGIISAWCCSGKLSPHWAVFKKMNSAFSFYIAAPCGHRIIFVATHLKKTPLIISGDPDASLLQIYLILLFPPLFFTGSGKTLSQPQFWVQMEHLQLQEKLKAPLTTTDSYRDWSVSHGEFVASKSAPTPSNKAFGLAGSCMSGAAQRGSLYHAGGGDGTKLAALLAAEMQMMLTVNEKQRRLSDRFSGSKWRRN